ncbi:MAG TPA: cobaltochelatase subunit CobN [Pyrinomonadaceae bacterium]|nr:cobaltochelatase subunit CobN [Pyrinomonadaceae bacterium]
MNVTVCYVGSSLLAPLKNAEREINRVYDLDLRVAAYNFGSSLSDSEWRDVDRDLSEANVVFVIHVMDGENAARLVSALQNYQPDAVVVINCMPDLMRLTRMGKLDVGKFAGWMGRYTKSDKKDRKHRHHHYLKLIDRLPTILKFVPTAGALTDAKDYLYLFCYFLQPTPANIQSMLLYSLKHYVRDDRLRSVKTSTPQQVRSVAIYHPEARELFETFEAYEKWHKSKKKKPLNPESTLGLLLMRPQVVSKTTKHYDALIHAIEDEGLSVIPAIATLMDNREAVSKFFNRGLSQIVSLTGFSFVGGPAMNDSAAAAEFLSELNIPYRSAVSLDTQTIEAWRDSATGLNPVQAGMQIAIPEIDGATEPFIYGGIPVKGHEPAALDDRCRRFARRLKRWNNLQTSPRDEVKLAIVLFCFPPNKGNIGTAADLDVFPSVWDLLQRLEREGYRVEVPATADELRERLLGGNSEQFGAAANVDYRMTVSEYLRLCPYVRDVEADWGTAPGAINSFGGDLLIQGLKLGNVFIGVQPTFGFEGDPMRLMMARSGSPHHGFMAFYTYLSKVFGADGVVHFGTHGALEFMPGKQIGLSGECWPDRLIDELPNFYVYSVNNPSEGSIAKRRSYAELISYLTPPIENAGLYRELAALKDLVMAYRQSTNENEREKLFESIQALKHELHFN